MAKGIQGWVIFIITFQVSVWGCGQDVIYYGSTDNGQVAVQWQAMINVQYADGAKVFENVEILDAMDWFAKNVHLLIPNVRECDVVSEYMQGWTVHIQRDIIRYWDDFDEQKAGGVIYYNKRLIKLRLHTHVCQVYATPIMHELLHLIEHYITQDSCPDQSCDQSWCETHRCPYWRQYGSILQYGYYKHLKEQSRI